MNEQDTSSSSSGVNEEPKRVISFGLCLRLIMAVYIVTLPSCIEDASHFGPGFFPLIAAFLLVPAFALIAFLDAVMVWKEVIMRNNFKDKWLTATFSMLMLVAYGAVVVAVLQKS